jgi:tRNA nucleotidyltransferase (CCA-adding enzyme)
MAYNDRVGVVDQFGGIDDLRHKIIRCVGKATERFTEDALRILRAIRFSAQLGFSIEDNTAKAIVALGSNLTKISKERIQTELDKLITSRHPDRLELIDMYGLNPYIFEGATNLNRQNPNLYKNISHTMNMLPDDHYLRTAALLIYEEQPKTVLKKLKLDNNTIDICGKLCSLKDIILPTDKPSLRRIIVKYGRDIFDNYTFTFIEALIKADIYKHMTIIGLRTVQSIYQDIIDNKDCISLKDMQLTGSDLMTMGIPQGKELGIILNRLFERVLDDPSLNNRETLINLVSLVSSQ